VTPNISDPDTTHSLGIDPMIEPVAAIFSAVNKRGGDHGAWNLRNVSPQVADIIFSVSVSE
jgi:hypothetical protein